MAFLTLGTSSELQIKVPTNGTTSWGDTMKTDTFQKIAEHNHTGSGNGAQLGTGSLIADAVTGAKIRLDNDEYLRGRNAADSANINIVKVDTNDELALGALLANAGIINDTYITGRNNADSANINMLKINTSDKIAIGADVANLAINNDAYYTGRNNADSAYINMFKVNTSDTITVGADIVAATIATVTPTLVQQGASVTLTDNTVAATTTGIITLASNEACEIKYRIVRGTNVQQGIIEMEESNSFISETFGGDDVGVTFTEDAGILKYVSTSTGNNGTMTYIVIKK